MAEEKRLRRKITKEVECINSYQIVDENNCNNISALQPV